ncbi:hypothetical protein GCM10025869_16730 [Homoserinibacter gongjuensis]|uniref:Uncharacterized protein n=1 Tax=Homoserinibacter gongjuensis TaxID=1162968 RepID=A0ABQ6JVK2_9MICO|nr:hypothetical protein GCM10025869_16730 [Homoserinibacter gongjuensis]
MNGFATALADATRLPVRAPAALESVSIARSVEPDQLAAGASGLPVTVGLTLGSKA